MPIPCCWAAKGRNRDEIFVICPDSSQPPEGNEETVGPRIGPEKAKNAFKPGENRGFAVIIRPRSKPGPEWAVSSGKTRVPFAFRRWITIVRPEFAAGKSGRFP